MKKLIYLFILLLIAGFISQTASSQTIKKEANANIDIPALTAPVRLETNENSILKSEPVSPGTSYYNPLAIKMIPISGIKSVGPSGADYVSITAALTDIVAQGLGGAVYLELQPSYVSAVETFPLTFDATLPTTAVNTITIRPQTSALGLSITSSAAQTVYINGGKYIYFDGRPDGLGTTSQLTIDNTLPAGYAFQLINDAQYNRIEYCTVTGVGTTAVISFSTTTGSTGNSNNLIDHCSIHDGASLPANLILSSGTSAFPNVNNTVSNSNLYNWHLGAGAIYLGAGSSAWTISGNSLYQTAARNFDAVTAAAAFGVIYVINSTNGVGFTISNNYIGGSSPMCGGAPFSWTTTTGLPVYQMLYFAGAVGTANNITGNTIANMTLSSAQASYFLGLIYVTNGNVNITSNTIGSQSTTGNLNYATYGITSSAANSIFATIYEGNTVASTLNTSNNVIGGITMSAGSSPTTQAVRFYGLYLNGPVLGSTISVNNNTIGGTVANSIENLTLNRTIGVASVSAALNQQITNNTVRNMDLNNSNTMITSVYPCVVGLDLRGNAGGSYNVDNNTIYTLTSNTSSPQINNVSSAVGMSMTANTTPGTVVSRNKIYDLRNYYASATGRVNGMYFGTPPSGQTLIYKNLIHSLSTISNSCSQNGIMFANTGPAMIYNNMIRLGIDASGASLTTSPEIMGIAKYATNNLGFYFNSVYIGGSGVASNAINTYCYYRYVGATGTDTVMDNILYNARSNASGTGLNYGYYFQTALTGLTLNYNDVYADGTGSMFGYAGVDYANLAAWQTGTLLDLNSVSGDPQFINPIGNSSTLNLHIQPSAISPVNNAGTPLAAVLNDYDNDVRSLTTPDIGADEYIYVPPAIQDPSNFTAVAVSATEIDLSWTLNVAGNPIIIAVNSSNSFGVPINTHEYFVNDPLAGGGTIIYKGSDLNFAHTLLNHHNTYYYKAFSYDVTFTYSPGVTANATTFYAVDLAFSQFYQSSGTLIKHSDKEKFTDYNLTMSKPEKGQKQFVQLTDNGTGVKSSAVNNNMNTQLLNNNIGYNDNPMLTNINVFTRVTNDGVNAATYILSWDVGGVAQSQYSGPSVPGGSHNDATLVYAPSALGTFLTTGLINVSGDENLSNNTAIPFRLRVYPDVFTRNINDNGTNVVDTYIGWGVTTTAMVAGVRYTTGGSAKKLGGVDYACESGTVTSGTWTVKVRAAGTTTLAPGAVLYTKTYTAPDYFAASGDYMFFPFDALAPTIAASTDYWITIESPVGIPYPGGAQGSGFVPGRSFYESSPVGSNTWNILNIGTEYCWLMRSIEIAPELSLGLTAMFSGQCNGTNMNYTKDVTVELHNSTTPYALVESKSVTLDVNGLGNPLFTTAVNGTPYYIVIRSNNGLETWSATPQTFSGSLLSYNFTTANTQAYGNNMLLIGTIWCIISGDADQNGTVNAVDRSLCWNDRNLVGVYATDFDGNGTVNALDRSIAWNNRNLSVAKPALALSPENKGVKKETIDKKGNTKGTYDLRLDGKNSKNVNKKSNN